MIYSCLVEHEGIELTEASLGRISKIIKKNFLSFEMIIHEQSLSSSYVK